MTCVQRHQDAAYSICGLNHQAHGGCSRRAERCLGGIRLLKRDARLNARPAVRSVPVGLPERDPDAGQTCRGPVRPTPAASVKLVMKPA